jgi:nicotinate-nucleotide--dimethylbenzimidazole phosphoribosyltransferase
MTLQLIPPIDNLQNNAFRQSLQHKIDTKTKPLGSLGRIEALALQIGEILGSQDPVLSQPQMVVFAGDHGLSARGISAFPSDVSWQMV